MSRGPAEATADGVLLRLRVQPGASKTAVAGIETDAAGVVRLKLRVQAPPVDGAANAAVTAFLAKRLGRPKRDVALTQGQKSRSKTVRIAGPADAILERLAALIGEAT